jgi:hypothetical protein
MKEKKQESTQLGQRIATLLRKVDYQSAIAAMRIAQALLDEQVSLDALPKS